MTALQPRLRLLSRPGCHLCEAMRREVDSDPALAAEFGEAIPVLFVNGRLFAKTRLPPIAAALRLRRAAGL